MASLQNPTMNALAEAETQASTICAAYREGDYFADVQRHAEDAPAKTSSFLKLLLPFARTHQFTLTSYADVGCGAGEIVQRVSAGLRENGHPLRQISGYDVAPHVQRLRAPGIEFIHGDFCATAEKFDLVTLFDVFEHVPDPTHFIRQVAQRAKLVGFIIPLDDSYNVAARDMYKAKLQDPGHLIFLDTVSALNLLAQAGLQVLTYEYFFVFQTPGSRTTAAARLIYPLRSFCARISPWLLSKTIGGASLLVLATLPAHWDELKHHDS